MSGKRSNKFEKLIGGIEIKCNKSIGTLGMIVYDNETGKALGLSNAHILSHKDSNRVYQPGISIEENYIGHFTKAGKHDCAVFEIDLSKRSIDEKNTFYELDGNPVGMAIAAKGMHVKKSGKNTKVTYGIVGKDSKNLKGGFTIKPNPIKKADDNEISIGGDSGSIWVTDEDDFKIVGLHSTGEKDSPTWYRPWRWFRSKPKDSATAVRAELVATDLNISFIKP